jgi:hypothetical protein
MQAYLDSIIQGAAVTKLHHLDRPKVQGANKISNTQAEQQQGDKV